MLCVLRLVEGLCQGVIFPSTHTLLSKWAPVSERAQLATYCYSGSQFGTVVMLSTSGILASSFMGWPSIFYISGLASGLWAILWLFFGSNSPADYKYISAEERDFIQSSLGHNDAEAADNEEKKHRKTPWGDIFTSLPFYSLAIVHSAHNWGFWTLLTEMPTYMKGVLKFDIKKVNIHFKKRLRFCFKMGQWDDMIAFLLTSNCSLFFQWFFFPFSPTCPSLRCNIEMHEYRTLCYRRCLISQCYYSATSLASYREFWSAKIAFHSNTVEKYSTLSVRFMVHFMILIKLSLARLLVCSIVSATTKKND